jgi:hypothetical protein
MRQDMLDFIIFTSIATILTFVNVVYFRLKNKNLQLLMILNQTISDVELLQNNFNKDSSVEKEHLIAFLNETRDVAYKYIEDVHKALLEYESEIEFDLLNPNDLSITRFRSAFEKLKKIYPQDIPND